MLRARSHRAGREAGYTLVEVAVAMLAGAVVMIALFTIQDVVLHQTSRAFSKVDATQRVRTALEGLENQLHSGCVTDNMTPVQGGSTGTLLMFATQYGSGATLTPVEDAVTFNAAAGTLTESAYAETGETTGTNGIPIYTFSSTPIAGSTHTVLTDVSQTGTTPVFQYFAYQEPLNSSGQPYTDSAGDPYMMLLDGTSDVPNTSIIPTPQPLSTSPSLSTTNAQTAAEVMITITVGPSVPTPPGSLSSGINSNLSDAKDSFSDGVVLRLTPAANHAGDGNVFLPCQ